MTAGDDTLPPWLVDGNRIEPGIQERNRRWARGLDGRTVWSHVLWIEPILDTIHGEDRHDLDANRKRARSYLSAAGVDVRVSDLLPRTSPADYDRDYGAWPPLVVTGPSADAAECAQVLEGALAELEATGFDYVVELALGAVAVGVEIPAVRFVGTLPQGLPAIGAAKNLLCSASRELLAQWYEAVRYGNEHGLGHPLRDFNAVAALFSDCLSDEFDTRRTERGLPRHIDPDDDQARHDRLARLTPADLFVADNQESIVAELVSYVYPLWDRVRYTIDSPFDGYRSLLGN
jgi:hypothetical protein